MSSLSQSQAHGNLNGQIALIWGASQGIGRGIAEIIAEQGATSILVARNQEKLADLQKMLLHKGAKVEIIVADISDESKVFEVSARVLAKYGRIDILVQNVGIYPEADIEQQSSDFMRNVFEVNLFSTMNAIKAVIPAMKQQRYGRIIVISSITGNITGVPGYSAYSASKAALSGMMKSQAIELAPFQITFNSVEPGFVTTEGLSLDDDYLQKIAESVPLGRLGTPREIGYIVSCLAHPQASYITGAQIVIDGGLILPESHLLHVPKVSKL